MNRAIKTLLIPFVLITGVLRADQEDSLEEAIWEGNKVYRTSCHAEDPVFNGVSASMFGWGIGLAVGIAVLTGLVRNSKGTSPKTTLSQTSTSSATQTNVSPDKTGLSSTSTTTTITTTK